jgi:hypothetical protein
MDLGSIQDELDALNWDNQEEEKLQRARQEKYRLVKNPVSFRSQVFNEAGPSLEGMANKCAQVLAEMESMNLGHGRDAARFSDKLLTLLHVELASRDMGQMMAKVEDERERLDDLKRHDIIDTSKMRTDILEKRLESSADAGSNDEDVVNNNQARKTNSAASTGSRAQNE